MHVPWAGTIMTLIILTAVLSCLNSAFYVTSRVLFTLAAHQDAPRWLVGLNRRRVPARSVLIGSAAGFAGILAATWSPAGVFAFLINASGALIVFIYLLTACAQIRLRRQHGKRVPVVAMWCYPWASYLAIAGMLAVLAAMALTPGLASQFYVSAGALALAVIAHLVTARVRAHRRAVAVVDNTN